MNGDKCAPTVGTWLTEPRAQKNDCIGDNKKGPFRKVSCEFSMKNEVTEWFKSSLVFNS